MTSKLKCPFCQQELDCMGKYTDGSSKWLCNKCGLFGDKKLFYEIIRTHKALDAARKALEEMTTGEMGCKCSWCGRYEIADKALEQIEHKDE